MMCRSAFITSPFSPDTSGCTTRYTHAHSANHVYNNADYSNYDFDNESKYTYGIYPYTTTSMALLDLTECGSPVQQGIAIPPQLGYLLDGVF